MNWPETDGIPRSAMAKTILVELVKNSGLHIFTTNQIIQMASDAVLFADQLTHELQQKEKPNV